MRFILANKLSEFDIQTPQSRAFASSYPLLAKTSVDLDACWDIAQRYPFQLTAAVASVAVVATGTVTGQWAPAGIAALLAYYNIKKSMNIIDLVMEHCFLTTGNAILMENYNYSTNSYGRSNKAAVSKSDPALHFLQASTQLNLAVSNQRLGPLHFEDKQMKRFRIQEEVAANSTYIGQDFQELVGSLYSWMTRIHFVASRLLPGSYYEKLSDYSNLMWRPAEAVEYHLGNISDPGITISMIRQGEFMEVKFANSTPTNAEITPFTFDLLQGTQVMAQYDATLRNNCWDAESALANTSYIHRYMWFVDGTIGTGGKEAYADEYLTFKPGGTYIMTDYHSYPDNRWDAIPSDEQVARGGSWHYDCSLNTLSTIDSFRRVEHRYEVNQENATLFLGHCVGLCEALGHDELIKN